MFLYPAPVLSLLHLNEHVLGQTAIGSAPNGLLVYEEFCAAPKSGF